MEKTRRNFLRESLLGVGALLVAPPMIANVLNVNERNIDKYKGRKACRKPFSSSSTATRSLALQMERNTTQNQKKNSWRSLWR